ncbi:hypothetical protein V6Z05_09890 [Leptospira venezuelensis]|uniref:hypothetical protein n=1 Tax=Leptospira venezuelensis TaxID=1958811 RepID=UPI000A39F248|nr:hypothetical protein [Leptospira venezuelensis]
MRNSNIYTLVRICLYLVLFPAFFHFANCSINPDLNLESHGVAKSRFEKALISLYGSHVASLRPSLFELQALGDLEKSLVESGWNNPENIQKSVDALSQTFIYEGLSAGEMQADMDAWDQGTLVWPKPVSEQKLQELRNIRITQMRSYYNERLMEIPNLEASERQALKLNVSAGIYMNSYMIEANWSNCQMDLQFQKENVNWLTRIREEIINEQLRNGERL